MTVELLPAESLALAVALGRLLRGEDQLPNTTSICVLALARLVGRHDWTKDQQPALETSVRHQQWCNALDYHDERKEGCNCGAAVNRGAAMKEIDPSDFCPACEKIDCTCCRRCDDDGVDPEPAYHDFGNGPEATPQPCRECVAAGRIVVQPALRT